MSAYGSLSYEYKPSAPPAMLVAPEVVPELANELSSELLGEQLLEAQRYSRAAVKYILREHPAQVDDVLQQAAMAVLGTTAPFEGRNSCQFKTWFQRICINQALMFLRKHCAKEYSLEAFIENRPNWDLESTERSPLQQAIASQLGDVVRDAILDLSPLRREAAGLWLMDIPVKWNSTLKTRRYRARLDLREALKDLKELI